MRSLQAYFHDIGKLVLAIKFPKKYEQVLSYAKLNDCHLIDVERTMLGIDHASVGLVLAIQWNFAEAIQDAIRGHHEPDNDELHSIAHIVHVANAIVHSLDITQQQIIGPTYFTKSMGSSTLIR